MSEPSSPIPAADVEALLLRELAARGAGRSASPTDIARALAAGEAPNAWRRCLPAVHRAARRLAAAGSVEILRKGRSVAPAEARGVIRLRLRLPGPMAPDNGA